MIIKVGVNLKKLEPQMVVALMIADGLFRQIQKDVVITSGSDGNHMTGSLHYVGRALDIRSHDLSSQQKVWMLQMLKVGLGEQFDVILEGDGTPNEHFHIEFDPKD